MAQQNYVTLTLHLGALKYLGMQVYTSTITLKTLHGCSSFSI